MGGGTFKGSESAVVRHMVMRIQGALAKEFDHWELEENDSSIEQMLAAAGLGAHRPSEARTHVRDETGAHTVGRGVGTSALPDG